MSSEDFNLCFWIIYCIVLFFLSQIDLKKIHNLKKDKDSLTSSLKASVERENEVQEYLWDYKEKIRQELYLEELKGYEDHEVKLTKTIDRQRDEFNALRESKYLELKKLNKDRLELIIENNELKDKLN